MSTTTRVLDANVNGAVYTSNANDALEAIDTCHSGTTAPTDEVANGKLWLDTSTTPAILKIYNDATWEVVLTATGTSQVKLDGIEALADVTDTANVTAAGAVMDSELTDIAAVKALNQGVASTDSPTFAALGDGTDTVATNYVVNGSARAWVQYLQSSNVVSNSFNVSSVGDNSTGRFTVNYGASFASDAHARSLMSNTGTFCGSAARSTTSTQFETQNDSGTPTDTGNYGNFHGDLA